MTPGEDGERWRDFRFRDGDIVISTPPKCGTTWTQMICALLIFGTPHLPAPLWELSPWLETPAVPPHHIDAQLAAQRHRRFIKTHVPLSAIPQDERVTYLVTARHPLDALVSKIHQDRVLGPPGPPPPFRGPPPAVSPRLLHDALRSAAELPLIVRHVAEAWSRRAEPNVLLLHYDDLLSDLDGQMRRVADRLGIVVDERLWPALVEAATFERMRARDDVLIPPPPGIVPDNSLFFRRGRSGAAREILGEEEMAEYARRVARLAPPDMIAWLHGREA